MCALRATETAAEKERDRQTDRERDGLITVCPSSQGDFTAIVDLPEGEHQYKFYVDGDWLHNPDEVSECVSDRWSLS